MGNVQHDPASAGATPTPLDGPSRDALRHVMLAWFFGAIWLYIVSGAALTRYAQLLGLSPIGFGLLAALPSVGALVQLPTSYFIERWGHHKPVFIVFGSLHRLLWLALALVPWVVPRRFWTAGLLGAVLASCVAGSMTLPIWVAWMSDLVPSEIRGRYFSRRNQLGQVVGLAVTLGLGWAMDTAELRGGPALLATITVLFGVAALSGVGDFLCFLKVPPPATHRPNPTASLWQMIRAPLLDRNFRRIIGFQATFTLATGYVGQFVWLYLFDELHMTHSQANLLFVILPLIVSMSVFPVWGRLIDRLGRKPVMIISSLLLVHGSAVWIFVRGDHWWIGYAAVLLATAAWPGIDMAVFNLLLGVNDRRRGQRFGSSYVAINSLVTAAAGIVSGLVGGAVAEGLSGWRGSLCGWPLSFHGVLFLMSGVLRLLSLAWIVRLEDRGALSTRAALRYMGGTLYSNLVTAGVVPARWLIRLGAWTYKLPPGRRRRNTR